MSTPTVFPSASAQVQPAGDACWSFREMPVFYTLQPNPETRRRQLAMWAELLVQTAATSCLAAAKKAAVEDPSTAPSERCPVAALFLASDTIFGHAGLNRRLPSQAIADVFIAAEAHNPSVCIASGGGASRSGWLPQPTSGTDGDAWLLVFACDGGHEALMRDRLLPWLLDVGGGLTTANLQRQGVVTTFDELCASGALCHDWRSRPLLLTAAMAKGPVIDRPVSNEHVLRLLLHRYEQQPSAVLPFDLTLFNLDGSDHPPFDGVKVGGARE